MRKTQPYPKDYATHMPIIVGLSRLIQPKNILEFGSGKFSTSLFLNRDAFPTVERVVSCEMAQYWVNVVNAETSAGADARHEWMVKVDEEPNDNWDIVFADSGTVDHKVSLIHKCARARKGITIIHDSEVSEYRFFRDEFESVDFQAFEPCTAIAWGKGLESPVDILKLCALDCILEKYCNEDPTDVNRWLEIFNKESV